MALSNIGSGFGEFGVHRLGLGLHRPIVANQSIANCELSAASVYRVLTAEIATE